MTLKLKKEEVFVQVMTLKRFFMLFSLMMLGYFIYHTYHGERGLIAQEELLTKLDKMDAEYKKLYAQRLNLEYKVKGLSEIDGKVDRDLLIEYARNLGYCDKDEMMIID